MHNPLASIKLLIYACMRICIIYTYVCVVYYTTIIISIIIRLTSSTRNIKSLMIIALKIIYIHMLKCSLGKPVFHIHTYMYGLILNRSETLLYTALYAMVIANILKMTKNFQFIIWSLYRRARVPFFKSIALITVWSCAVAPWYNYYYSIIYIHDLAEKENIIKNVSIKIMFPRNINFKNVILEFRLFYYLYI